MTSAEHTHTPKPHLTVVRTDNGWEIQERRDGAVVRVSRHTDWHRVERSLRALEDAGRVQELG